ncbi:Hypp1032 [Branchiostoma lanceolatum]|uniref:Hypp1032 protein n=1 Tax=Branchiostoma lanceolatum TaxID=7740 RepID=A0A8J9ZGI4_BRALA|nr:Hypp1032 [Branchiostoma lanceolatum]
MQPLDLGDLQKGATAPGDCGAPHDVMPPWMDRERFDRGREFIQRHLPGVFLSQYMALLIGFSVAPLLDVLLFTGKSSTVEQAMRRYISTGRRLMLWHDGDVWDVNSKAHASVMNVRNTHGKVARDITKDRKGCDTKGKQGDETEDQEHAHPNGITYRDEKRLKGSQHSHLFNGAFEEESHYQDVGNMEKTLLLQERLPQDRAAKLALVRGHATTTRDRNNKVSQRGPWWFVPDRPMISTGLTRQRRETAENIASDVLLEAASTDANARSIDDDVDSRDATNPNSWTEYGRSAPSRERPRGRFARVRM